MKLYLILPVVALAALAAEPVMARGFHGHGGRSGGGGPSMGRNVAGSRAALASPGGMGGAAISARLTPSRSHGHHGHHGRHGRHGHHGQYGGHHHHQRGQWRGAYANTYPRNFANWGYTANYNTPYYQGGFRQQTSPYGFPSVYQNNPYAYSGYAGYPGYTAYGANSYGRSNRVFSYGTGSGFYPYTGYYAPYYQGQPQQGYRAYGVYGPNGPYTVPGTGVGTAAVQSRLYQSGYYRGPVDGFAGPLTRTAIRNYQYQWGLPVTGRIDGHLLQSLRNSFYYY